MKTGYVLIFVFLVTACAVGPDYKKPVTDTPAKWRVEEPSPDSLANTKWWEQFNDPVLTGLVTTALKENHDLLIATARVDQYLGLLGVARSQYFPQFGYNLAPGVSQQTKNGAIALPDGERQINGSFQIDVNVNWELDIWGKIRRANEAAKAQLLASEEARRAVIMTLVSEVATGYFALLSLDKQLEITKDTVKSRKESVELNLLQYKYGVISELELNPFIALYEDAAAQVPELEKQIAEQENALCVILGKNPQPIPRGKTLDTLVLPSPPANLPSEVLEQRPDIREAEQNLIAANAQIGVAKAQYFPSISLTALTGFASADLTKLFSGGSWIWNVAGAIAGPIFTFGQIEGQVKAAEAVQQQTLQQYVLTIQTAFKEVNNALVAQEKLRKKLSSQQKSVMANRKYNATAELRYSYGYSSYMDVLTAQRDLFQSELSAVQTKQQLFGSIVSLYKSMGGGWIDAADPLRPDQTKKAE